MLDAGVVVLSRAAWLREGSAYIGGIIKQHLSSTRGIDSVHIVIAAQYNSSAG